jgi:hypothetical protein
LLSHRRSLLANGVVCDDALKTTSKAHSIRCREAGGLSWPESRAQNQYTQMAKLCKAVRTPRGKIAFSAFSNHANRKRGAPSSRKVSCGR